MVDTADEAKAVVQACRYPPAGNRSFGPGNHYLTFDAPDMETYFERANREVLVILQTESPAGVANAPSIYGVEGVDWVLVGPRDLRGQMRKTTEGGRPATDEEFEGLLSRAVEAAKAARMPLGLHVPGPEHVERRRRDGFSWFTVGSDRGFLHAEASRAAAACGRFGAAEGDARGVGAGVEVGAGAGACVGVGLGARVGGPGGFAGPSGSAGAARY
jgi:4-hydroxy-2-oxoheptanedioate aldolase